MITTLHRGGYAQMITVLHGGGSLGTPKSDYVICARPQIAINFRQQTESKHYHYFYLVWGRAVRGECPV